MSRLSKLERDALPSSAFAVPGKRKLLIQDASHLRFAWDELERTQGLSEAEREEARRRILARARELGIDTSGWMRLQTMSLELGALAAMSLAVPTTPDHPNKLPFAGVLTKIDEPSDKAPFGSFGRRVQLARPAVEAALPTLLGMAVDFAPGLDGHDATRKIGVITGAEVAGNELRIEGFFYAADFPEEIARIRADKAAMGFSFEAQRILVADLEADPLVITACVFTGAAVLQKDKAAFITTRLAARAAEETDMDMNAVFEKLEALGKTVERLSEAIAELKGAEPASPRLDAAEAAERVRPYAERLMELATDMERQGVGCDPARGHAAVLRRLAGSLAADAAAGRMPSVYCQAEAGFGARSGEASEDGRLARLEASVASIATLLKDLKAQASSGTHAAPERRTIPPAVGALLAKANLVLPQGDGKLSVQQVDEALGKTNFTVNQKLQVKNVLAHAGMLH